MDAQMSRHAVLAGAGGATTVPLGRLVAPPWIGDRTASRLTALLHRLLVIATIVSMVALAGAVALVQPWSGHAAGPVAAAWPSSGGVTAEFTDTGPVLTLPGATLSLGAVSVAGPAADGTLVTASSTEASYEHAAGVTSWYRRVDGGIEHGFTLGALPSGADPAHLTVAQRFSAPNLLPLLEDGAVAWLDTAGVTVATYRDLLVTDATGRELPSQLGLDGTTLTYTLDTRGAVWPVTVDPLISAPLGTTRIVPPTSAAGDHFGRASALDGDTAVIGASGHADLSGVVHVFTRSGTTWTRAARILPPEPAAGDEFGKVVAIDGGTILVGAHHDDILGNDSGSVHVYVGSGAAWTLQQTLTAADGAPGDRFGQGLDLEGDTAIIGADSTDGSTGSAYVFTRSGTVWTQVAELNASDRATGDDFGYEVALEGTTAVVGAHRADRGTDPDVGAAYVFTGSGATWTEQAKLQPDGAGPGDFLAFRVALSGDTVLVSSHLDDTKGDNAGAAYVFTRTGTEWTEQAKLTASDGKAGDRFGYSARIDGDTALIGALRTDDGATNTGSSYVFRRDAAAWAQQAEILNPTPEEEDLFGRFGVIDGTTVLLGAFQDATFGTDAGAAYVFTSDGTDWTTWTLQASLFPDASAGSAHAGRDVSLDGDTLLVGAPDEAPGGVAYVFVRSGETWTLQAKLEGAETGSGDSFGRTVALSGDTAVVGAPGSDRELLNAGAAYVFVRTGTTWSQQARLIAEPPVIGEELGTSVAIDGDTVVVGVPDRNRDAEVVNDGAADVFVRSGTSWIRQASLSVPDAVARGRLGASVAVSGDLIVLGGEPEESGPGSAYAFARTGTAWTLEGPLVPEGLGDGDQFGADVALSGSLALIGAPGDDGDATDAGAAYVFARDGAVWTEQAALRPGAPSSSRDAAGSAVALEGQTAILGANRADGGGRDAGTAYVFTREDGAWTLSSQLDATDAAAGDRFGRGVAISGPIAAVGAHFADAQGADSGAVYAFDLVNSDANGPYEVGEGGSVELDGLRSFGREHTAEWDLDDDGIFGEIGAEAVHGDEVGLTPVFRAGDLPLDTVWPLVLRITNGAGSVEDTSSVTVVEKIVPPPPPPPPPGPPPAPPATGGTATGSGNGVTVTVTATTGPAPVVTVTDTANGSAPNGHEHLPVTAEITASGDDEAPVTIRFTVPTASLPTMLPGETVPHVAVVRDGRMVAECSTAGSLGPDPCVTSRTMGINGLTIEILTSSGSAWNLGIPAGPCSVGVPSHGFSDLAGNRHASSVACARWWELVKGTSATAYSPGQDLNRGQLATVLVGLLEELGADLPANAPDAFADDEGSVHEGSVDTLAALGIYRGRADGTSGISAPIDRGQVATLLLGALTEAGVTVPTSPPDAFTDDDGATHEASLDALAAMGIYKGTGDGAAGHRASLRRDQAATLLVGALESWFTG